MLKKLVKQLKRIDDEWWYNNVTSPISYDKNLLKKKILSGLTKHALDLYVKKSDIRKFTNLVLSDPYDTSHVELVDKLFGSGTVVDPFSNEKMDSLIGNSNFLKDLGLEED